MSVPVFLEVLPLALGSALSPLVVAGELFWLSDQDRGLRRGWLFVAGNALVVAIWLAIGVSLGHLLPPRPQGPDVISAVFRLVMAVVMAGLGVQLLLHRPRGASAPAHAAGHRDLRAFALGLGVMAQNISSLLLFFPAVAEITRAREGSVDALLLIAFLVLATLSPCLLPPLLVSVGGRPGRAVLERFSRWLKPKQWFLGLLVFFGMAAYLLISGIGDL